MALMILVVKFLFLVAVVSSSKVTLQNPGFETRPTNLTTNATSQFMLLDTKFNVIPGWSYNGTVWYVTAGENVSLPGNGHGLQLGPNSKINQTFRSDKNYDENYDYVLTFTLAPSSIDCANNSTAVNVSAPGLWKVFFYKESLGTEMWQTYAYSIGRGESLRDIMSLEIKPVATSTPRHGKQTCWPVIDTVLVTGVESPRLYSDKGMVNSGFEVGPTFLENSSQGILLEADSNNDPSNSIQSPLQAWTILGIVKYISPKGYAVPRGQAAIELVSGNPSGILQKLYFLKHGQVTLDFIMGDANNSCVGDFMVFLQVGNTIWNFTMRSNGVGSRERHSVTFKAEFSNLDEVPISFASFNETRTSDQVLCGPVIDSTVLRSSIGLRSKKQCKRLVIFSFVFTLMFLFLS